MRSDLHIRRDGYLTIDALVALALTTVSVAAAVGVAAEAAARLALSRDRLTAVRIADDLYQGLYDGALPDGSSQGRRDNRSWSYVTAPAGSEQRLSSAREVRITVERKRLAPLVVDAVLPPAPATPSSNS